MSANPRAERILAEAELSPYDEYPIDPGRPKGPRLTFKRAELVEIVRPVFLWDRWLVRGGLHLLIGRQGLGKSTFAAYVAAHVNIGLPLHGDATIHEPCVVAMLSLEEPDDRLVARLAAAGADLSRVLILGDVEAIDDQGHTYRRPWRLPLDCGALESHIAKHHVALVTIDGLGYSVAGDSHNYANVGAALSSLAGVAERTGAAILGLTHPPKGASEAVTAAIGSTAWTSVPRICWIMGKDPDDNTGDRIVVGVPKSNFQYPETSIAFSIGNDEEHACGYVTKLGSSSVNVDALTAASESADERSVQVEIAEVLKSLTADGLVAFDDARKALKVAGYDVSDRTIQRARTRAGLVLAPPGRFGGKRSFGRPEHLAAQSGQDSLDTPSPSQVSRLCPDDANRENIPSHASVDSSAEEASTLSDSDHEPVLWELSPTEWSTLGERVALLSADSPARRILDERGYLERTELSREEYVEVLAILDSAEGE